MTSNVYEIITERILEALDQGTVPWRKPWTAGIPRNAVTNRRYNGINSILLGMSPYADQRWITYKQAGQPGGNVLKGERSSLVVFWKQLQVANERDEETTKTIPLLRYLTCSTWPNATGLTWVQLYPPTLLSL